jgi:hypothetical protein
LIDDETFQATKIADVGARVEEGQTIRISEKFFDAPSNTRGPAAVAVSERDEFC